MDRKRVCALLAGVLCLLAPVATTGADRPPRTAAAAIKPARPVAKAPVRRNKRHRLPHIRMTERDWRRVDRIRDGAVKVVGAIAQSMLDGALDPDNWGGSPAVAGEHQHVPRSEPIAHHEPKERSEASSGHRR